MTDTQVNDADRREARDWLREHWEWATGPVGSLAQLLAGTRIRSTSELQSQLSQSNAEIERRDELLREAGDALAFALGSKTGQLDQRHQESMVIIKAKIDTLATESQDG